MISLIEAMPSHVICPSPLSRNSNLKKKAAPVLDHHESQCLIGWWLTYPSEKNMSSSVGMMTFPIYGKIKIMFQTTNQLKKDAVAAAKPQHTHSLIWNETWKHDFIGLMTAPTCETCCRAAFTPKSWKPARQKQTIKRNRQHKLAFEPDLTMNILTTMSS